MSTPTIEGSKNHERPGRGRWYAAVAAVAAVAIAVVGIVAITQNGNEPDVVAALPLELTAGPYDSMAMCIEFSVEVLAPMPVAFEGTVTAAEGDVVTLAVDHWYKGGDAAVVTITAPAGLEALIGGIAFETGGQYLITATDGIVNYCGFSAASTPDLRAAFEAAFPG